MIRAVLWKEWREQAAIIVALLALGGGVMATAVQLGNPVTDAGPLEFAGYGQAGRLALLMLALTAGTVIGGALFAGEAEAGTTGYLDALPATRWRVWRGKVAAGLVLTALAGTVLIAEGVALGAAGPAASAAGWALWVGVLMLAAYGWGAFGSVRSDSTLAACGIGLLTGTLAGAAAFVLAAVAVQFTEYGRRGARLQTDMTLLATAFLVLAAPLPLAGLMYSAPDRARYAAELTPGVAAATRRAVRAAPPRGRSGFGLRALVWLLFRQSLVPAAVLGGLALLFGSVMLVDNAPMVVGWPAATLLLGALVGVIGWADEQGKGAYRFWGERRLPAGRLWLVKVVWGLGLALGLSFLYLLPTLVRAAVAGGDRGSGSAAGVFGSWFLEMGRMYTGSWSSVAAFALLWPVYGFAAGHLAGLLFRKAVVAAGVAVLAGGTFAGVWLPSIFAGGLHHWQLWPAPLAALLTARVLIRAWAGDRLTARRPAIALGAGLVLVAGLTVTGLGYRVAEVLPAAPEADDDLMFVKTIPGFEENEAGRELRSGVARYLQVERGLVERSPAVPLDPVPPQAWSGGAYGTAGYLTRASRTATAGWPDDRPDLDEWLDAVFKNGWEESLFVAAGKPLGVLEDPTTLDAAVWLAPEPVRRASLEAAIAMGHLMIARGLQKQARGDPAAYVRYLDATLALARNAKNKTVDDYVFVGRRIEANALTSVDRWLERLAGRPDLLRQLVDVLARHEATVPTDPTFGWLAGRTVIRTSVTSPSGWATKYLAALTDTRAGRQPSDALRARMDVEVNLLGFAWVVPWEKERLRRVVGVGNDPARGREVEKLTAGAPGMFFLPLRVDREGELATAAARRAGVLKAALRLYLAETGRSAASLDQLVPKYLPAIPADPFDGRPFRYRRSAGERVVMESLSRDTAPTQPAFSAPGLPAGGFGNPVLDLLVEAAAAVAEGRVQLPKLTSGPPGVGPESLPDEQFDAVGAVAGGLVQWPLPPLTPEAAAAGGTFPDLVAGGGGPPGMAGMVAGVPGGQYVSSRRAVPAVPPADRRVADVVPGQGILWSVGPDRVDDQGQILTDRSWSNGVPGRGDLIYIVPLPAGHSHPKKENGP